MISDSFLFRSEGGFIRLPIWGHIPLSAPLKQILAHPAFLRLKGIRQLSFAQQVYPGANHTRFEHSIGVYHLMKLILQRIHTNPLAGSLQETGFEFDDQACRLLLSAALLHDIGHYPHAHVLEEQAPVWENEPVFACHESLVSRFLSEEHDGFPPIGDILTREWHVDPDDVTGLIAGSRGRFGKLISGTLDPDKMDYLMRDAHHCNIPYGSIDIERLIESFVPDPERQRFAITEKGIAPLESLLFAKYMMMRNVYWHHTSRTFSVMLRRFLQDMLDSGMTSPQQLRHLFYGSSDDRVLYDLEHRMPAATHASGSLLQLILQRRIYKRALTAIPYANGASQPVDWMFAHTAAHRQRKEKEYELCRFIASKTGRALEGHEILLDPPSHKDVFDYDDLKDLRVYQGGTGAYVSFDELGESAFRPDFILAFERCTKKFRIICREDLVEDVQKHEHEIMEILEVRKEA
ncbi:HD domain-containing protein [Prosthecochloris sp. N3]|uniref:HD domain-containing protein n=1 Tax=Prosthecochloris ethylica TaxID=2743976 RepID=A0ABR9XNR6_9CHLB|nr:HD domain-containing protein [Prosthecochloris ethylica]MBF0585757.1 HD domain-containing protein [Prosthecochloris ethylica]MBF0635667.1 HD domain-containing protein [Prosthecochloris ethylica]NUK46966.1 HD domain-containing protein [Prosthecochloris ethylica]